MTSWTLFYGPLTSDFGQVIKVKSFVQGRISRPINGSELIFHMRMYLYETSRNIQEPWPPDLYFMVCWLQTLASFPWLIFLSSIDSWALLMVANWYFIRGFTSMRPGASAFKPRVHAWGLAGGQYIGHTWFSVTQTLTWNYVCRSVTYISWSCDFALSLRLFSDLNDLPISACSGWSLIWKCLWM